MNEKKSGRKVQKEEDALQQSPTVLNTELRDSAPQSQRGEGRGDRRGGEEGGKERKKGGGEAVHRSASSVDEQQPWLRRRQHQHHPLQHLSRRMLRGT